MQTGIRKQSGKLVSSLPGPGNTPLVGLLVLVVQWLHTLGLLELGQLGRVGELEEGRGILHQPLGVDSGDLPEVLLGSLHHLVEHNPLRLAVEEG